MKTTIFAAVAATMMALGATAPAQARMANPNLANPTLNTVAPAGSLVQNVQYYRYHRHHRRHYRRHHRHCWTHRVRVRVGYHRYAWRVVRRCGWR